jgi:hypothetical protein
MNDLPTRLFEDASIMRTKGGFPTIAAELDEAAEEILSLKGLLGKCLDFICSGSSDGRDDLIDMINKEIAK